MGIWQILEELDFQLPIEDLQIGLNQYIIEAHQTLCMYQDGVLRPVVLVHVIDYDTGREQMLALTESEIPPRIEHWTLEGMRLQAFSGAEVMTQRAERMQAKAPTVAAPPGYPSGSSEVPKASAPQVVPKASVPKAKARVSSSFQGSTSTTSATLPRANQAEQVEVPCATAARAELGPQVLVDSGANEVIRPRPEHYDVHRCRKTQVALASGDTVHAWRTRDGELMIGDVELDQNADWILSVRRLRGIRVLSVGMRWVPG